MKRVSIIGGGNVGTNTAFFLAENGTAPVTLVDIKEGVPVGKALDLMEAGPLRGYDTMIEGTNDVERIAGSDVVLIAAGRVRQPGERRGDLYKDNADNVREICGHIKRLAPGAVVVNVVEPVDALTLLIQEELGLDRHRVLGVGGLLSSTRIRYLVSTALQISPREATALIIGPHRRSMVVLRDSIRVSGIPAETLLGRERLDEIIEDARGAGDAILEMAQHSTSYYAPSAAAVTLIEAVVRNTHAILPVSLRLEGEYGVKGLCVGVPAMIGQDGVEKIIEVRLTDDEKRAFAAAIDELKAAIAQKTGRKID
jgi:malate dehydrogenase